MCSRGQSHLAENVQFCGGQNSAHAASGSMLVTPLKQTALEDSKLIFSALQYIAVACGT